MAHIATRTVKTNYEPTPEAQRFHAAPQRYRFVVNGIKSGKTYQGAYEAVRHGLGKPGAMIWVVAPTYQHLQTAWMEVGNILTRFSGLVSGYNNTQHQIKLVHGGMIWFRSADRPHNLKGPNVDSMWIDEAPLLKAEAWWFCKERIAATRGEIFATGTPNGRNWFWDEVLRGGMPNDQAYGEFNNGNRWVSHYPTWHFPWAGKSFIEDARQSMPRALFDQEYGALFTSAATEVFHRVEESLSLELPPEKFEGSTVIGLDLAKIQDFTAMCVMDNSGRVLFVDHWNETNWSVQKPRIIRISKDWNGILICDSSNMGSVIVEDLQADGIPVVPVDLHDSRKKREIIEGLQIAFENSQLKLRDYRAEWATRADQTLYDELKAYASSLTSGGRISYGAPRGLHDDMVVALALANWGRSKGQAGGVGQTFEVMSPRRDWTKPRISNPARAARRKMFGSVYGKRKSAVGFEPMNGSFWGH